jgi:hypothetical protein
MGVAAVCACPASARAQQSTDSSAQSSPLKPPPPAPIVDDSAQASPITGGPATHGAAHIAAHTAIAVRLTQAASSATLKNGETLSAVLTAPVKLTNGSSLTAGTKVSLTVVVTVPAGKMDSAGDFTLQVDKVGAVSVTTDIQEFHGKPGHKDLPDSTPTKGTEAELHVGSMLTFHVQAEPAM